MKAMFKAIGTFILCHVFGSHKWTCNAEKGIPPNELQKAGGIAGFKDYARMYCDRCGVESDISRDWRGS